MSWVLSVVRTKATVMLCLCDCVQLYELGAVCGENEGDGDVVTVCSFELGAECGENEGDGDVVPV